MRPDLIPNVLKLNEKAGALTWIVGAPALIWYTFYFKRLVRNDLPRPPALGQVLPGLVVEVGVIIAYECVQP